MNATLLPDAPAAAPPMPAEPTVRSASFQARNVLLDEAYEEFCVRQERGELVDIASFCEHYQAVKSSLRRVIDAHLFLDNSPALAAKTNVRWPEAGARVLGFELEAELGRGSFSRVYLARQPELGNRRVVVKLTPFASREASYLGRLNHPAIVPIHSIDRVADQGFSAICMPYLGAATVDDLLDNAFAAWSKRTGGLTAAVGRTRCDPLPPRSDADVAQKRPTTYEDAIVDLACQVLSGLAHAHAEGIVHGDLKPSNILLTPAGRPLLIDFNLSAGAGDEEGIVGGTLFYMAPERLAQLRQSPANGKGERAPALTARADVYSLGVVLYQLLLGRLPFDESGAGSIPLPKLAERLLAKQEKADQIRIPATAGVDRGLVQIVRKAMRFSPEERYSSAGEMLAALEQWRSTPRRGVRWAGQHKLASALVSLTMICALGGAAYFFATRAPLHARLAEEAQSLFAQGQYAPAIENYSEAIRLDRSNPDYFFQRGQAYLRTEDFVQARADFVEVTHAQPDNAQAQALAGYCYCHGQAIDYNFAKTRFNEAIKGGLKTAGVYHDLGVCWYMLGFYEEAKKWLTLAIEANPNQAASYYYRAGAEFNLGQLQPDLCISNAAADLEKAIGLAKHYGFHEFAADVYCKLARSDRAAMEKVYYHAAQAVALGADGAHMGKSGLLGKIKGDNNLVRALATPLQEKTCALPSKFSYPLN